MVKLFLSFFHQADLNGYTKTVFDSNRYSNSSKDCVLEVVLKYHKELHNDNTLAPDKIEIKKVMSNYQLKIADFYNISIANVKKLEPNFFLKRKTCDSLWKFSTLFEA